MQGLVYLLCSRDCAGAALANTPASLAPATPLQRNSSPLALVSSAPEQRVLPALEQAGLAARFDAIVTADDVYRGKPDPEGYLYAAQVGAAAAHELGGGPASRRCCRRGAAMRLAACRGGAQGRLR